MTRKTCEHIRDLLPAHVDGALDATDAEAVGAHLAECAVCRREREQWVALSRLLDEHLTGVELASEREVAAVLQRVRQQRPVWRVAPTPVRFWRGWLPAAAMGATALALTVLGAYAPGLRLADMKGVLLEQAAVVAEESRELPQSAPEEALALYLEAREWPEYAAAGAVRGWDEGRAFTRAVVRRIGLTPLATCLLLLLAANLMIARGARLGPRVVSGR